MLNTCVLSLVLVIVLKGHNLFFFCKETMQTSCRSQNLDIFIKTKQNNLFLNSLTTSIMRWSPPFTLMTMSTKTLRILFYTLKDRENPSFDFDNGYIT